MVEIGAEFAELREMVSTEIIEKPIIYIRKDKGFLIHWHVYASLPVFLGQSLQYYVRSYQRVLASIANEIKDISARNMYGKSLAYSLGIDTVIELMMKPCNKLRSSAVQAFYVALLSIETGPLADFL
jgi:hypothetical protein